MSRVESNPTDGNTCRELVEELGLERQPRRFQDAERLAGTRPGRDDDQLMKASLEALMLDGLAGLAHYNWRCASARRGSSLTPPATSRRLA